jgi:hypothetical protein
MPGKERYINLFTDYGFKKIFGEEPNKNLLLDFLNELLKEEQGEIRDLKNSLDTAFEEGKEEGEQKKEREIVINGLRQGLEKEMIASLTGLSIEAIEKIEQEI